MKSTAHSFEQKDLFYKKRGKETSLKDNKDIMASSTSAPQELPKFDVLAKIRDWIGHQKNRMKDEEECYIRGEDGNEETRNPKEEEYRTAGFHPWYNKRFYLEYDTPIGGFMLFDLKEVQIAFSRKGFLLVKELKEYLEKKTFKLSNINLLSFFSNVKIVFYDGKIHDFYVSSGALSNDKKLLTVWNERGKTEAVLRKLGIQEVSKYEEPTYRDRIIESLSLLLPPTNLNAFEFLNP